MVSFLTTCGPRRNVRGDESARGETGLHEIAT